MIDPLMQLSPQSLAGIMGQAPLQPATATTMPQQMLQQMSQQQMPVQGLWGTGSILNRPAFNPWMPPPQQSGGNPSPQQFNPAHENFLGRPLDPESQVRSPMQWDQMMKSINTGRPF